MNKTIAHLLEKLGDWIVSFEVPEASGPVPGQAPAVPEPPHACPRPTARAVVDAILNRPIEWVDWRSLPNDARLAWGNDARAVLENRAFISICGKMVDSLKKTNGELVKRLIENGVRYSETHQQLKDVRMTINGIELVREELEAMLYQEDKPSMDDLNAAV